MANRLPPLLLRYGLVPVAVGLVVLVCWALMAVGGAALPFVLLWPVVIGAAWFGGLGSGLLAAGLSALAGALFLYNDSAGGAAAVIGGILFLVLGGLFSRVVERLHRALQASGAHFRTVVRQYEELRATFAGIAEAVVVTDPAGHVTFLNAAAGRLTGWKPVEAAGKSVGQVCPFVEGGSRKTLEGPAREALSTGATAGLADGAVLVARDGGERPVAGSAAPVRDHDGRLLGAVLVFHDAGEHVRKEHDIAQKLERLAEADRHKDQLLAVLARDLHGPLTPLRGALQRLQDPALAAPERDDVNRQIGRQLQTLTRLADNLLDMIQLAQGLVQPRREGLDLAGVVHAAAEERRASLQEAGLTLAVDVPETAVWVKGDAARLAQVLHTLLDEEAKRTDVGGRVTVRVGADADRRQAVLSVHDTGRGMEPGQLAGLFEAPARPNGGPRRWQGGLALTLVKEVVELHGGTVQAASSGPGQGIEFTVRLPLEPEPAAVSELPRDAEQPGRRLRVLVIEDNRESADSLGQLLNLLGHEAAVAYSGPEGVELARQWRPHVVLCDVGLPGLDGYGVAAELRRLPELARASLIALTGHVAEDDRRRSQEAGFDQHLTKPVDPHVLKSVVALQALVVP